MSRIANAAAHADLQVGNSSELVHGDEFLIPPPDLIEVLTQKGHCELTDAKKKHPPKTSGSKPDAKGSRTARTLAVLDGKQRRYLRSLAHDLQPILQVGKAGATEALVRELDRALETHELVKLRALRECPSSLDEILELAERSIQAARVGHVGRVAIVYRARSKNPSITLPKKADDSE